MARNSASVISKSRPQKLLAGSAVSINDLVFLNGLNGKASPVVNTVTSATGTMTYGTAQTDAATGRIVAQTTFTAGSKPDRNRSSMLYDDGNLFIAANGSTTNGITLYKYNTRGSLLVSLSISAAAAACGRKLFELSNGDIAIVYDTNAQALYFQILDKNLISVKSETTITSAAADISSNFWDAIPLSGGGFAVVFSSTTANLDKFITYNNAGTVVTAETTINTRTGTTGAQKFSMVELSNANIAIVQDSANTTSSIGGYYSVITNTGTSVKAFTQVSGITASGGHRNAIEKVSGYFCVAAGGSTGGTRVAVYDNAGTIQGSATQVSTGAQTGGSGIGLTHKLVTDGTDFYWVGASASDTSTKIAKITTAGVVTTANITLSTTNYNFDLDIFYNAETNSIVGASLASTGNVAPELWVVDTNLNLINKAGTGIGTAPGTTAAGNVALTDLGDGAFASYYSYTTTAANAFVIGKYATTAVIGIADEDAAAGSWFEVRTEAGACEINAISGVAAAFDMSSGAAGGNSGSMYQNSAILRGL